MIIARTPFRISFFGGGTDYPAWFEKNNGAVLATTIDKYCYLTTRYLPPFFNHKHRIVYSKIEYISHFDEIQHPSVRECLKFMDINSGIEIHYDADLPARTGLGTSSSFTVGLLHTLYALNGKMPQKMQLAKDAIHVEQKMIKENVGCQDQIMASFGGFNLVEFQSGNNITVKPITINPKKVQMLNKYFMLFYTGISRTASEIAKEKIKNIPKRTQQLSEMYGMVNEAISLLNNDKDINEFGKLMHENWKLKRSLCNKISNSKIDELYEAAISAGASGGKLLGAGGGGFLLIFAPPERQPKIKEKLKKLLLVPFKFESLGSQIIFYNPNSAYE